MQKQKGCWIVILVIFITTLWSGNAFSIELKSYFEYRNIAIFRNTDRDKFTDIVQLSSGLVTDTSYGKDDPIVNNAFVRGIWNIQLIDEPIYDEEWVYFDINQDFDLDVRTKSWPSRTLLEGELNISSVRFRESGNEFQINWDRDINVDPLDVNNTIGSKVLDDFDNTGVFTYTATGRNLLKPHRVSVARGSGIIGSPVPEPATLLLVASVLGIAGISYGKRRFRQRSRR